MRSIWHKRLIAILLVIPSSVWSDYCIQVASAPSGQLRELQKLADRIAKETKLEDIRIERIGRVLALRVGDYPNYRSAAEKLYDLRHIKRDAFARSCDIIPSRIVTRYKNGSKRYNSTRRYEKNPIPLYENNPVTHAHESLPEITEPPRQRPRAPRPIQELSDSKRSATLWEECKKCFAPVYEDEDIPESEPNANPSVPQPSHQTAVPPHPNTPETVMSHTPQKPAKQDTEEFLPLEEAVEPGSSAHPLQVDRDIKKLDQSDAASFWKKQMQAAPRKKKNTDDGSGELLP